MPHICVNSTPCRLLIFYNVIELFEVGVSYDLLNTDSFVGVEDKDLREQVMQL